MEKKRFIHIGVGGFGKRWVRCLRDNPDAEVVALVDVSEEALSKACEIGGYEKRICFSTLRDALEKVDADAVVCVTPPEHHRPVLIEAMKAGLDAISEKPMAESLESCKAILRTALETGRTCVISQNYRFKPKTWTLADLITRGTIGEIGQVKIDFYMGHDFHGGFRHEMDYPLLIDMSIHHFDLVRFVTGLDPVSTQGTAWNPSWSNYKGDCSSSVIFEMENGARVVYNASWCAKGTFCDWNGNWQIEGQSGTLVYENKAIILNTVPELYNVVDTEQVPFTQPQKLGQDYVVDDFITSLRSGTKPQTDVFDNIQSIGMVFAAVRAVKTREKIPVLDAELQDLIRSRPV